MNAFLIKQAKVKLNELLKKFDGFEAVFLDDWRGYRFIYDVGNRYCCRQLSSGCPLSRLLKNEQEVNGFTAGLYTASPDERRFFGPQEYLNCKTFKQYQRCYVRFLLSRCKTRKEIFDEMDLVKNLKLLYSKQGSRFRREREFRKGIVQMVLRTAKLAKKRMVREYLKENPDFRS